VEHSASQNVNVEVGNGLPRPSAVVDHSSVTSGLEAARASELGDDLKKVAQERLIFKPGIVKSREVAARDH